MSEPCKVVAAVTVEGVSYFGQNPGASAYVCAATGIYAAPVSPVVCGTAAVASAVGVWAITPAGRELMTVAAEGGCRVVVRGGEILLVKGREVVEAAAKSGRDAARTYRALNTYEGIRWLMRVLSTY